MSDKAFINYKDQVLSFPIVEKNMGIFRSGRYSGFDNMSTVSDLIINISHSNNIKKTVLGGKQENNFGAYITPTGTIIHQQGGMDLTISDNIGNTNTRTDWIISTHTFSLIQGGSQPSYSVIQGPNNGNEPTLTDDKIETLLAKVQIAPGGTTFNDLTLIVISPPLLGNTTAQNLYNYISNLISTNLPIASQTVKGILELATGDEVIVGTSNILGITPATLLHYITNSDIVVDANYVSTEQNFTTVLYNKLLGIEAGAEVNVQSDWLASSGDAFILNKPNIVEVLLQGRTIQAIDIDGSSTGAISNSGFSSVTLTSNTDTMELTFTFPTLGTDAYQVLVTPYSTGSPGSNNQWQAPVVMNKSSTSFDYILRETGGDSESLLFHVTIIKLQ